MASARVRRKVEPERPDWWLAACTAACETLHSMNMDLVDPCLSRASRYVYTMYVCTNSMYYEY